MREVLILLSMFGSIIIVGTTITIIYDTLFGREP